MSNTHYDNTHAWTHTNTHSYPLFESAHYEGKMILASPAISQDASRSSPSTLTFHNKSLSPLLPPLPFTIKVLKTDNKSPDLNKDFDTGPNLSEMS